METILPIKYVFNTNNVLTKNKIHVGTWDKITEWLYITFFTSVMFLYCVWADFSRNNNSISIKYFVLDLIFFSLFGLAVISTLISICDYQSPFNSPYDIDCQFKLLPKSNLIVMQSKTDCPKRENEVKGYSYRLYVENPAISGNLLYLAVSKNGQVNFIDNTEIGKLFASYCYYAQKHNLTDKFKNALYFVKDPNTTDANGVPQYVLKGDGITLKIKTDKNTAYQIYAVNE